MGSTSQLLEIIMKMPNRLSAALGVSLPLLLALNLPAFAQPREVEPGWSPWQPEEEPSPVPFSTGFSNADASVYGSWGMHCAEQASAAKTEPTYWYRLDELVTSIGTGYADQACRINEDAFYRTGPVVAIRTDLTTPVCLHVNAARGNGLVLRDEPDIEGKRLAALPNGSTVEITSLPHSLMADGARRQWLSVRWQWLPISRLEYGWVLARAQPGEPINLRLCK